LITGPAAILVCYLLGAIPFGLIVSRIAGKGDIRKLGSGNIGATNVWRVAGAKFAIWVFIGDIGKGVAAVLLAKLAYYNPEGFLISRESFLVICIRSISDLKAARA
jgi:glycerol-3-phosphate acyltransferase PlsY